MCGITECVRVKGVNKVQVTDIRIRSVEKEGKMKAVVSITEGEKGMFIAMPSRKASDGEYRDIAHPINTATRERLQNMILAKYRETQEEE